MVGGVPGQHIPHLSASLHSIRELAMTQKTIPTSGDECDRVLQELRAMPETEMHQQVVIPLLRAIGATHTSYVHGPQERGKDIAYVYNDIHGCDSLGVCQVKNEKLSGRAGATTSAFTVLEQLRQSRTFEVINPKTNQKELPDSAVLYTTWPLPDGAYRMASPSSQTSKNRDAR